jgi:undecaprenol kinase
VRQGRPRRNFWRALGNALWGLAHAYRREAHLRFHVFALSCVLVVARAVALEGWEVAYLSLTAVLVIGMELVNSAVERAVDLTTGGARHPLARQAKDVAAGAVLAMAIHAVWAGGWLFGWRRSLMTTVTTLMHVLLGAPWMALLPILTAVAGLLVSRLTDQKRVPEEEPR